MKTVITIIGLLVCIPILKLSFKIAFSKYAKQMKKIYVSRAQGYIE